MRNLVRVVVLDRLVCHHKCRTIFSENPSVVDFLLFLGKLVIVILTGVASYMAFSGQIPDIKVSQQIFFHDFQSLVDQDDIPTLNYFFTPVVFIVIGSYFIARYFRVQNPCTCFPNLSGYIYSLNLPMSNLISALSLVFTTWLLTHSSCAFWKILKEMMEV